MWTIRSPAHAGDHHGVHLPGGQGCQAVTPPEVHAVGHPIALGGLLPPLQGALVDVGGHGSHNAPGQQKPHREVGMVGAHVCQPGPLGHLGGPPQPDGG